MANFFQTTAPNQHAFEITPDDEADLPQLIRAIYVGTAGDIKATLASGAEITFKNVAAGHAHVLGIITRIHETDTTAADLIGMTDSETA